MTEPQDKALDTRIEAIVLCADETARDTLAFWLRSAGIKTGVAHTGREARALSLRGAQLLITDRLLPPWPGLPAFLALKQERTLLKIAFIDDGVPDNRALAYSAGADIILPRPLRRAAVMDAYGVADPERGRLECAS